MTLADKMKLANDMASEDPEYTIRNYLDVVAEIEAIEKTNNLNIYGKERATKYIRHFADADE